MHIIVQWCVVLTTVFRISASLVPNLHWTFDVDENKNTYEMRSVTQNVGNMLSGTTALPSNERYGSVAHFNGKDSGIIIDNVTSSCFIDPGICTQGLSFSFWINWQKWGTNPILASPSKYLFPFTFFVSTCVRKSAHKKLCMVYHESFLCVFGPSS